MSKVKTTTQKLKIKTIWRDWNTTIYAGMCIFVLGLGLRLINLTLLPVFGDEAIYIRWSQIMGAEPGLRFVPLSDGKQPLFMWVLMFIVRRFSDPLFIGRLTSVFYGLGTLVGIFVLTYYLFKSKKIALISSFFWAISPYSIFYDRLALVDSMLTMFGVWTLFFAVVFAKTLRLDFAMLTGFSLGAALLTKSPAVYFAIMLPITWIVTKWPEREKKQHVGKKELIHLIKLLLLSFVTIVIGYGMYNILRLGENFHIVSIRNKDYVYPINHLWQEPSNPFVAHVNDIFDWLWKMGPSVLVIFVLLTLLDQIKSVGKLSFKSMKRPKSEVALLFFWSTIPLFVSAMYAKVFTARYILFSLPTIYIFAALIFSGELIKKQIVRKVIGFGLFVFILQSLYVDFLLLTNPRKVNLPRILRSGYLEEWTAGTGIKETADLIRNEHKLNPDQKIVVGTEGYFGTLPDGLQMYLNNIPEITVIGVGLDINEIPKSLEESKGAGNKTFLVINNSRLKADYGEIGLELIARYPKAVKPDSTFEELYLLEVSRNSIKIDKSF